MITTTLFHYPHFDRSKFPLDVRKHRATDILWEHCYFIGFRISVDNGYDYQHSLVLADGYEEFQAGVRYEIDAILHRYPELKSTDVVPVYIRNLQLLDDEFLTADTKEEVREEIQDCLGKRDDTHFIVMGLFAQKKLGILEMHNTQNALDAIRMAIYKGGDLYGNGLVTLEVRNAHPVNSEFDVLVLQTAARMKALEDSTTIGSGMLN